MARFAISILTTQVKILAGALLLITLGSSNVSGAVIQLTGDTPSQVAVVYPGFPETFESGSKTSYAAADVTLSTGAWHLDDALTGTSSSDRKNGSKALRIQNTGRITMNFDLPGGATQVSLRHASYGTDAPCSWELYYSTNGGSTWVQAGGVTNTSSVTLTTATFPLSIPGTVRFQIRKTEGGRLNIDDFSVSYTGTSAAGSPGSTRDDNMAMGNPSGATASSSSPDNYLVVKTQYVLSYNNSKGTPNWVSWHLSPLWKGTATRCDCFTADNSLPPDFFHATTSNYTNTGFDRGHMCPSDDRDCDASDNAATFLMTNIIPQAPNNNQQTWGRLEAYCRTLVENGYELYIIAGVYGTGGAGSQGGTTSTIAGGSITVPARVWKVIVVLPVGSDDVSRVSASTRIIAVDMPNTQSVTSQPWGYYRTTVDAIESATGYNLLSNVSATIQGSIESVTDNGPTQ